MNISDFSADAPKPEKKHGFKRVAEAQTISSLPKGVNLVDYSQLVLSTIMATFRPNEPLDLDMLRHLILNTLRSNVLKNKKNYPFVIICVDNGTGGYWRKKVAWYYKFKRAAQRDASGWDFSVIFDCMKTIEKEIRQYIPMTILDIPGCEADDHIAVMTKHFANQGVPVLITSSDGDFTQLHKFPNVKQWDAIHKKWVSVKHGSSLDDLFFKCFKGDKKDGIAGVKATSSHYADGEGRSPALSSKLLETYTAAAMISDDELKLVMPEAEFIRYKENRLLLDFECIPTEIQDKIINEFKGYKVPSPNGMMQYFTEHELKKLLPHMDEFICN